MTFLVYATFILIPTLGNYRQAKMQKLGLISTSPKSCKLNFLEKNNFEITHQKNAFLFCVTFHSDASQSLLGCWAGGGGALKGIHFSQYKMRIYLNSYLDESALWEENFTV